MLTNVADGSVTSGDLRGSIHYDRSALGLIATLRLDKERLAA